MPIIPHFDYLKIIYGRASTTNLHGIDIIYKKVDKIAQNTRCKTN